MDTAAPCHFRSALHANGGRPLICGCRPNPRYSAMHPGSVAYPHLVHQVNAYFTRDSIRSVQESAISEFDNLNRTHIRRKGVPTPNTVRQYALIFDRFFFQGMLLDHERCYIGLDDALYYDKGVLGSTSVISECFRHRQIHSVRIRLASEPLYCGNEIVRIKEQIDRMLITLLCEMCRAMLLIYGCKCHCSLSAYLYYFGITGYGAAFQKIFLAVMAKANDVFSLNFRPEHDWEPDRRKEEQVLEQVALTGAIDARNELRRHVGLMWRIGANQYGGIWTIDGP